MPGLTKHAGALTLVKQTGLLGSNLLKQGRIAKCECALQGKSPAVPVRGQTCTEADFFL